MKRFVFGTLCGVLLVAVATFAGESKCKSSTQECLDYMATKMKDSGWVGVELERDDEKYGPMTVVKVVPDSPAEAAGIQPGDVLVAMNGIELSEGNQEKIKESWGGRKPGQDVTWTMRRGDEKREVSITLAPMPADVLARYIGQHMLDHASTEVASK